MYCFMRERERASTPRIVFDNNPSPSVFTCEVSIIQCSLFTVHVFQLLHTPFEFIEPMDTLDNEGVLSGSAVLSTMNI